MTDCIAEMIILREYTWRANAEEGKPEGEILPGYGPLLGLELLTEWHGKANQRG